VETLVCLVGSRSRQALQAGWRGEEAKGKERKGKVVHGEPERRPVTPLEREEPKKLGHNRLVKVSSRDGSVAHGSAKVFHRELSVVVNALVPVCCRVVQRIGTQTVSNYATVPLLHKTGRGQGMANAVKSVAPRVAPCCPRVAQTFAALCCGRETNADACTHVMPSTECWNVACVTTPHMGPDSIPRMPKPVRFRTVANSIWRYCPVIDSLPRIPVV
jgi:hypothetical protein